MIIVRLGNVFFQFYTIANLPVKLQILQCRTFKNAGLNQTLKSRNYVPIKHNTLAKTEIIYPKNVGA